MATALQLRQAGFPDEFVLKYIEEQRPYLKKAGFTDSQINKHYGIEVIDQGVHKAGEETHLNGNAVLAQDENRSLTSDNYNQTLAEEKGKYNNNVASENSSLLVKDGNDTKTNTGTNLEDIPKSGGKNQDAKSQNDEANDEIDVDKTLYFENKDVQGNEDLLKNVNAEIKDATDPTVMYYDELTKGQQQKYNRNRSMPKGITKIIRRDEQGVTREEKDKVGIVNTNLTTGAYTVNFQKALMDTGNFDYFGVKTINEFASFVARFESDNANVINGDQTKSGLWQLSNEELPELIQFWINKQKEYNKDFVVPKEFKEAMEHKSAMLLQPHQQRTLFWAKMMKVPDSMKLLERIAKGDKVAMREMLELLNPASKRTKDEVITLNQQKIDAIDKELIDAKASALQPMSGDATLMPPPLDVIKALEEDKAKLVAENERLAGGGDVPDDFTIPRPNFDNRATETFDLFNTADYKYQLPELANISTDGLDWWVTKGVLELGGEKIVRFVGGAGPNTVWKKGAQQSVFGMVAYFHQLITEENKTPAEAYQMAFMWQSQGFGGDILEATSMIALDFPLMVGGCLTLTAGASFATGGTATLATPVLCGAGAFALPEMLRDIYTRALMNGKVYSIEEVMEELFKYETIKTGIKYGTVGAVTAGTGQAVRGAGAIMKPKAMPDYPLKRPMKLDKNGKPMTNEAGEIIYKKGGKEIVYDTAVTTAAYAAEVGTMVTLTSFLNNTTPTRHDFAHAAIMIFGMNRAQKGLGWTVEMYRKYGIHPKDLVTFTKVKPEVKNDLLAGKEPEYFVRMADEATAKMEKATDTKFIPEPKFELGTVVNTSVSGTATGKVVGREFKDGQFFLTIEKANTGEKIIMREAEVTMHEPINTTKVNIDKEGKVTVENNKRTDFKDQQAKRAFEPDIVEVTQVKVKEKTKGGKEVEVAKNEVVEVEVKTQFKDKGGKTVEAEIPPARSKKPSEETVISEHLNQPKTVVGETKGAKGTDTFYFDAKAFPTLAKIFDKVVKSRGLKPQKQTNRATFFENVFGKMRFKEGFVDPVFIIKANGTSGARQDVVVLRSSQDGFVAVPKDLYNVLMTYIERGAFNRKITKETNVGVSDQGVIVTDVAGKVIAAIKGKKLDGKLRDQAEYYYNEFKKDSDKYFYTKDFNRSSKGNGDDAWGAPDEPPPVDVTLNASWKNLFREGLDTFDLVQLTQILIDQTPMVKRMPAELRGYFRSIENRTGGKVDRSKLEVAVNRALQENPKAFTQTLAHEIGHLLDYLPQETMASGNILGRLAVIKNYMNQWIDATGKGGTLPTKAEIAEFKKKAEASAKQKLGKTEKQIREKLKIEPEQLLSIFRDTDFRKKIDPDFYDAFAKLDGALKKLIAKDAMKNMLSPQIKAIVDGINARRAKTPDPTDAKVKAEAEAIFAKMMEKEMIKRGLVDKQVITKELIKLSQTWKPFNRAQDPSYTKYRDSSKELMADFMMSFLLRPNWTYQNAPRSTELFMQYMSRRPEIKDAFDAIHFKMVAGKSARFGEVYEAMMNMVKKGNQQVADAFQNAYKENGVDNFNIQFIDNFGWFYRRLQGPEGGIFKFGNGRWYDNDALNLNYRLEKWRYQGGFMEQYMSKMTNLIRNLEDGNIGKTNTRQPVEALSIMLILRNLAFSKQRAGKANPLGLWSELRRIDPDGTIIRNEIEGGRSVMELYKEYKRTNPELDVAAEQFYAIRNDFMGELIKSSMMFSRQQVRELLNNVEYISFNNLKSLLNRVDKYGVQQMAIPKIMQTKGSLEPIADPLLSTIQKDLLLINAMNMNRAKLTAIQWMNKNKSWLETFDVKEVGQKDRVIQKAKMIGKGKVEPAPAGMTTVSVMRLGKQEYWHMNKFAAKAFAGGSVNGNNIVLKTAQIGNDIFRGIFTEYNPRFWAKNLVRDISATVRNVEGAAYLTKISTKGFSNPKEAMVYSILAAASPAFKGIFGKTKPEIVNYMERNGFLLSTKEGYQTKAGEASIRDAVEKGYISRDQALIETMMLEFGSRHKYRNWFMKYIGPVGDYLGGTARAGDRMPKIGAYNSIKAAIKSGKMSMSERELMLRIQQDVGSPAFLRTSEYHLITNNFLIFYNAMKEGIRRDYVRFREDPQAVGLKYLGYELTPKVLQKFLEMTPYLAFGKAFYDGISEYDKANYIVIPLMWWENPATGNKQPVYLRIPQDENARIINNIWYRGFNKIVGDHPNDVASTFFENTALSPNPAAEMILDVGKMFIHGENPISSWTGEYAIDEDVWKADNHYTTKEKFRYLWNNYGGNTLYTWKSDDVNEVYEGLAEILNVPVLGPFIQNFVKIGETPAGNSNRFKTELQLYDKFDARIKVAADAAANKIFSGRAHELTKEEEQAFALKFDGNIKNDPAFKGMLMRELGGTELLSMYMMTNDRKRKLLIYQEIIRLLDDRDTGKFPKDIEILSPADRIEDDE